MSDGVFNWNEPDDLDPNSSLSECYRCAYVERSTQTQKSFSTICSVTLSCGIIIECIECGMVSHILNVEFVEYVQDVSE